MTFGFVAGAAWSVENDESSANSSVTRREGDFIGGSSGSCVTGRRGEK